MFKATDWSLICRWGQKFHCTSSFNDLIVCTCSFGMKFPQGKSHSFCNDLVPLKANESCTMMLSRPCHVGTEFFRFKGSTWLLQTFLSHLTKDIFPEDTRLAHFSQA
ncbi:hypothetical protein XENOCAPTIV_024788 [Xenoophorus captivus]|uniref:Uncharacterized protein n=1 Tax=Xenoophorus captivus TaxID=1517983 RepID=A0ABV0RXM7_9TELE